MKLITRIIIMWLKFSNKGLIKFLSIVIIISCCFGCNEKQNTQETILYELFEREINFEEKEYVIILVSDADCSSCFHDFAKCKSSRDIEYIGLYVSKYSQQFRKRLEKINSNINWKELKNKSILKSISNINSATHGPYYVSIKDGKLTFILV